MPSAVAIITTYDPETGTPAGLAASAVIPVSMEPPSMLISINTSASAHKTIEKSRLFCVNLLGVEQSPLVGPFSKSAERDKRFADPAWQQHDGLPYLSTAASSIFCRVSTTLLFGTHELFIGEIFNLHANDTLHPLGWLEGDFAKLDRLVSSS